MNFLFAILDIHMNEKETTCHDGHGFKWQNITFILFLFIFLCGSMSFVACWIVTASQRPFKHVR
jgi:hypothetical protein